MRWCGDEDVKEICVCFDFVSFSFFLCVDFDGLFGVIKPDTVNPLGLLIIVGRRSWMLGCWGSVHTLEIVAHFS